MSDKQLVYSQFYFNFLSSNFSANLTNCIENLTLTLHHFTIIHFQEMQPKVLCVVIIFFLCFITGICGNASILTIIRGIMSERRNVRHGGSMAKRRESDNAILYLAALCLVDFVMSLSLPPAILDSIIGFWLFGTTVCKVGFVW